jgi:plastocyanin
MVDVHYWIQIENRPWDASPCVRNPDAVDRMTGRPFREHTKFPPTTVTIPPSPAAGSVSRQVTLHNPIRRASPTSPIADALILRRYRPPTQPDGSDAWTVPDDRKINPWDLNEPDPGEKGTRGTIPGPTIECDVGDRVFVHFRNKDHRAGYGPFGRTHSLHTHGFVFAAGQDGAYPLSPPDLTQPVGTEAALWAVSKAEQEAGRLPRPPTPSIPPTHNAQQFSPMDTPVSQFEDTRAIGPANSLVFTIDGRAGSFMRAGGRDPLDALGEWHMHCHVLDHMMAGMMGSLLIVEAGQLVEPLPVGHPMQEFDDGSGPVKTNTVHLTAASAFDPPHIQVDVGTTVTWIWDTNRRHTVTSDADLWPPPDLAGPAGATFTHTFTTADTFPYYCEFHGAPGGIGMRERARTSRPTRGSARGSTPGRLTTVGSTAWTSAG